MEDKFVITIGRQYGSGGRKIGMMLADIFGIGYYDKRLITEAAKRSGLADETFEQLEERKLGTLSHALSMGFNLCCGFTQEDIFRIQSETILDIAEKESCVIVGRSADYVLRNHPRCVNIFIHADLQDRKRRVAQRHNVSYGEAENLINKTDKSRASYYDFYAEKTWGESASYHMSIDSSALGLEGTAKIIAQFVRDVLAAKE